MQRAFSGNFSEPQWPLTTDSRVRRCRVDRSRSNYEALYRFHCHKRTTTVDVLALVVALFRIFGKGKSCSIRIAGRADHADDCSCNRRNIIDFNDLRDVVKITHPVNSVVSGRVLLS